MPIFDIKCTKCNNIDEVICTHDVATRKRCSKCKCKTQIQIGGTDFRLKGPDWQGLELASDKKGWESPKRYTRD